jgi:hypothetical protein
MPLINPISLWIKIPYTLLAAVILPVYAYKYGATNFLWFSDLAFFAMVYALWCNDRLLASILLISVVPLELLWLVSFLSGGAFLGMANYMFDPHLSLWLRGLSLFHFPMPAVIIYMIIRFGYDVAAVYPAIIFSLIVILLTHALTLPLNNINIIYPPIGIAGTVSNNIYFMMMPLVLVFCSIIPFHLILKHRLNIMR